MIRRLWSIGVEMIPSGDLVVRATIRAAIGVAIIWAGYETVGKICLVLAAITLVGHAEGVFVAHAAGWIKRRLGGVVTAILMPVMLVLLWWQPESATWEIEDRDFE